MKIGRSGQSSEPGVPRRHFRYYNSEHLIFVVDGYLFQLPVRRLKQSKFFRDMLDSEHLDDPDSFKGRSDEHPIALDSIKCFEMESFADVLDARYDDFMPLLRSAEISPQFLPRVFDDEIKREWKQLAAALHLATMWGFKEVKTRLVRDMSQIISDDGIPPLDRIEVSVQCGVSDWLHPAYQELCERTEGMTNEEAKRLGMDRLAAVYRVRDRRHAHTAAVQNSGHCGYCGRTGYMSYSNNVQTPTLDLIKAEEVLSSVEGPLS
ncbi:hypothetical protein M407DRAFT_27524 [Tulasnella calospora MUT 4182]|uniref:BTB domain-containing protein n=1 Tax=Tulasnella calospora MUT 4182 TaxID=1051891 RepID=A0A0C3Q2Y4_9AGAM|nr:hypothetical protein M407DRAFT_27524 [Tulasnella calospora MUT 4182]